MLIFSTLTAHEYKAPYWLGRYCDEFDLPPEKCKFSTLLSFAEQGALLNTFGITFQDPESDALDAWQLFPDKRNNYEVSESASHRHPLVTEIFRSRSTRRIARYNALLLFPFIEIYAAHRLGCSQVGSVLTFEDLGGYIQARKQIARLRKSSIIQEANIALDDPRQKSAGHSPAMALVVSKMTGAGATNPAPESASWSHDHEGAARDRSSGELDEPHRGDDEKPVSDALVDGDSQQDGAIAGGTPDEGASSGRDDASSESTALGEQPGVEEEVESQAPPGGHEVAETRGERHTDGEPAGNEPSETARDSSPREGEGGGEEEAGELLSWFRGPK